MNEPESEYKTLADTVKVWDNLPVYLQFKEDPSLIKNSIDNMYESIYYENVRFREAKGLRPVIRKYLAAVPAEQRSWKKFNDDGFNTVGIKESDYNREMVLVDKGVYGLRNDFADEDEDLNPEDTRPEFDPDSPDANPLLAAIYRAQKKASALSLSAEESVARKYKRMFNIVASVASSQSLNCHAFICGEGGIGKTYTVEEAVDFGLKYWKPNEKHKVVPTKVMISGSIGKSFTPILIFFYKNRHNKLIVLDDADGFLLNPDQDIQNFFKGILNTTLKGVTTPVSIRNRATKQMQDEADFKAKAAQSTTGKTTESLIKVNTSRLAEGKCSVNINGQNIDFNVTMDEALELGKTFGYKRLSETKREKTVWQGVEGRELKLNLIRETEEAPEMTDNEAAFMNKLLDLRAKNDEKKYETEGEIEDIEQIPDSFIFDSNVILISNLAIKDIEEAVISRCDKYELRINPEEFICHSEQILPNLKMGLYSSTNRDVIEWCKKESFAILKTIILNTNKFKNFDIPIKAHLDFRLLGNIANCMILNVNDYCNEKGIDPTNKEVRPEIEAAVQDDFMQDLLELLATG